MSQPPDHRAPHTPARQHSPRSPLVWAATGTAAAAVVAVAVNWQLSLAQESTLKALALEAEAEELRLNLYALERIEKNTFSDRAAEAIRKARSRLETISPETAAGIPQPLESLKLIRNRIDRTVVELAGNRWLGSAALLTCLLCGTALVPLVWRSQRASRGRLQKLADEAACLESLAGGIFEDSQPPPCCGTDSPLHQLELRIRTISRDHFLETFRKGAPAHFADDLILSLSDSGAIQDANPSFKKLAADANNLQDMLHNPEERERLQAELSRHKSFRMELQESLEIRSYFARRQSLGRLLCLETAVKLNLSQPARLAVRRAVEANISRLETTLGDKNVISKRLWHLYADLAAQDDYLAAETARRLATSIAPAIDLTRIK